MTYELWYRDSGVKPPSSDPEGLEFLSFSRTWKNVAGPAAWSRDMLYRWPVTSRQDRGMEQNRSQVITQVMHVLRENEQERGSKHIQHAIDALVHYTLGMIAENKEFEESKTEPFIVPSDVPYIPGCVYLGQPKFKEDEDGVLLYVVPSNIVCIEVSYWRRGCVLTHREIEITQDLESKYYLFKKEE